jgi:Flp pilus assembly protein TadB
MLEAYPLLSIALQVLSIMVVIILAILIPWTFVGYMHNRNKPKEKSEVERLIDEIRQDRDERNNPK